MELLEVHFHIRSIVGMYKDWRREVRETEERVVWCYEMFVESFGVL